MRKTKFDLDAALVGLFQRAQKEGDYSGCASLARVLRDLAKTDEADPRKRDHGWDAVLRVATPEERAELQQCMDRINAIRKVALTRLGATPVAPLVPEPARIDQPAPPVERVAVAPKREPDPDPNELIEVRTIDGPKQMTRRELEEDVTWL